MAQGWLAGSKGGVSRGRGCYACALQEAHIFSCTHSCTAAAKPSCTTVYITADGCYLPLPAQTTTVWWTTMSGWRPRWTGMRCRSAPTGRRGASRWVPAAAAPACCCNLHCVAGHRAASAAALTFFAGSVNLCCCLVGQYLLRAFQPFIQAEAAGPPALQYCLQLQDFLLTSALHCRPQVFRSFQRDGSGTITRTDLARLLCGDEECPVRCPLLSILAGWLPPAFMSDRRLKFVVVQKEPCFSCSPVNSTAVHPHPSIGDQICLCTVHLSPAQPAAPQVPDVIEAELREADANGDASISFEEFLALLRQGADDAHDLQLYESRLVQRA